MAAGETSSAVRDLLAARARWLGGFRLQVAEDPRIVAAWLSGSMGRGDGDEWADLDIHLIASDESSGLVLATPADAEVFGELLIWCDCPHNAPPGGRQVLTRFLVDGHLVMVDLNVWPRSFARRFPGCRDLIEPRAPQPIPPTGRSSHEMIATVDRPEMPTYGRVQQAEWVACMIHVATGFPPRGHDAARMLRLIEAELPTDPSPVAQLRALEDRLDELEPLLTKKAFDASRQRLRLAGQHLAS